MKTKDNSPAPLESSARPAIPGARFRSEPETNPTGTPVDPKTGRSNSLGTDDLGPFPT
jgi:hypothetical protein